MAMNNMHVLLGGVDGRVRVLHPTTGQVIHTLTGHTGEIASIQYCTGTNMFITGSKDGDKAVLGWRPFATGGGYECVLRVPDARIKLVNGCM
jgi:WD40 repeat protein